jgi:hypothetical protein
MAAAEANEVARNNLEQPSLIKPKDRARKLVRTSLDATNGTTTPPVNSDKPKYFSPEWWAQVREEDERLKKAMSICRGC